MSEPDKHIDEDKLYQDVSHLIEGYTAASPT